MSFSKEAGARAQVEDLHEHNDNEGYVVEAGKDGQSPLKLARDGHTILIPQASDDPHDPLNWSWTKKHLFLIIVSLSAFLPDYGSATGAVTLLPQAALVMTTAI